MDDIKGIRCRKNFSGGADDADRFEQVICKENEIKENEMKQLDVCTFGKVLLIKKGGELSAIGTKCPHYGAPLITGTLSGQKVRCPWHGACFNIKTGDIEDFPGMDSLPCYNVRVDNGLVKVSGKRSELTANKRVKKMVQRDPENKEVFVIIGGGPSGAVCAETLRQEGFTGRIVLVNKESALPYDRVKISKNFSLELDTMLLRNQEFYDSNCIETIIGVEATEVNCADDTVRLSNGYSIKYDKLYIATGSRALKPPIPGVDLNNVFTLRTYEDASDIDDVVEDTSNVVCLGLSFISLEAAATLSNKADSVTVVGRDSVPLKPVFGPEIGQRVLELFEERNVNMIVNSGITRIIGDNKNNVTAVELLDGREIPCDILILGTGSSLNTDFLKTSCIEMTAKGAVIVDSYLRTNFDNVYAGGDIAHAPIHLTNEKAAIGHYQLAQYHGKVAAKNMIENKTELQAIPFFWTALFGRNIRYCGYGKPEKIQIVGELKDMKFIAYFFDKDGNVNGVASCMRDPIVAQYAALRGQGKQLHRSDIAKRDSENWTTLLD